MTLRTNTTAWKNLEKHAQLMQSATIKDLKGLSAAPQKKFCISTENIHLDYSNQRLNETTLQLLFELAHECQLKETINALMTGSPLNTTENKPALHTALRVLSSDPLFIDQNDIIPDVLMVREQMRVISNQVRNGEWLGYSGLSITDVVNIGIGGSHLGPQFCITALTDITTDQIHFHFISDFDPHAFKKVTTKLNPETTLFIISSKSFTTQETLYNAKKALAWLDQPQHIDQHFIAITAHREKAELLGFKNILLIWDWVGGRYSLFSAINLITCIAIGFEQFHNMLEGASEMDNHFRRTDFSQNLPVLLALIGIWNNNFLHIHNLLLLTYSQDLQQFTPYVQQLDMESNGKSVDKQGRTVNYATGPIIWGGAGNQAQHSYYQLLCQGTHQIAADLIDIDIFNQDMISQLCIAHKEVLAIGIREDLNTNSHIPGNTPINHIRLTHCTPKTIGALVALYEHKIFTQGVIWNINSFDQPGVESAKKRIKEY